MCHDPNLLRCFNIKKQVSDMDYYGEIDKLLTVKEPKDKMPLLKDVLELVHTKVQWLLIDIKMDNPIRIIHEIAKVLQVEDSLDFWAGRILLGIWHDKFLQHISLSTTYARSKFLHHSQVQSLNMYLPSLYNENSFIKEAQAMGKTVLVWTVNDEDWMHWALDIGVDGVISDYPNKTMKVIHEKPGSFHWSFGKMVMMWTGKILGRIVMTWRVWKWSI
ncbi:Phosphatidylglycerol phospholipase C [Neolecta irregularis DAH-3]|uniref:Phosphatidylglycerol phospholipase C n=1 Tax=Neolecta irregularis (strain DAH-3) TaxID=1198029 RepID=A0A1U7LN95_NEOID|nr:Phosphatidylglycerol phospholipase C [Neolecta irregularis DAH-3]|eukprot:OLL24117.1 Phosphatidylglycerol phospholipase C [Neolecta irregularis DAH-3]